MIHIVMYSLNVIQIFMNVKWWLHIFMKNLIDRLDFILGDRKKHSWGNSIGLLRGTIDNLFKTGEAKGETLAKIGRCENTSITWLLEGKGTPYLVAKCNSDDEAADYLNGLLEEKGWLAYICEAPDRNALVLSLPASFKTKKEETINFTVLEIITSPGTKTLNRLKQANIPSHTLSLNSDRFNRLSTGWMGNQELLALLTTAQQINSVDLALLINSKPSPASPIDDPRLWHMLDLYRALTDSKRDEVIDSIELIAANALNNDVINRNEQKKAK